MSLSIAITTGNQFVISIVTLKLWLFDVIILSATIVNCFYYPVCIPCCWYTMGVLKKDWLNFGNTHKLSIDLIYLQQNHQTNSTMK